MVGVIRKRVTMSEALRTVPAAKPAGWERRQWLSLVSLIQRSPVSHPVCTGAHFAHDEVSGLNYGSWSPCSLKGKHSGCLAMSLTLLDSFGKG